LFILYLDPFDDIPTPVLDFLAEHNEDAITLLDRSYLYLLTDRIKDKEGENKVYNFYILAYISEIMFNIGVVGFFKAGLSMFFLFFLFLLLFVYRIKKQTLILLDFSYGCGGGISKITCYSLGCA
jgi:hypothetical protein